MGWFRSRRATRGTWAEQGENILYTLSMIPAIFYLVICHLYWTSIFFDCSCICKVDTFAHQFFCHKIFSSFFCCDLSILKDLFSKTGKCEWLHIFSCRTRYYCISPCISGFFQIILNPQEMQMPRADGIYTARRKTLPPDGLLCNYRFVQRWKCDSQL